MGHADKAVKAAFFELSGEALDSVLHKYGELYGENAREYASDTIPKWLTGTVQMSGMVAKRLFDLLPPFMPAEQRNNIVETIWKRYGPHSRKFFYLGSDSNSEAIMAALQAYLEKLAVLYPIPDTLRNRFDWLSQNDAVAKERLLNHFMDRQRHAAIASARLNVPMILSTMQAETKNNISKLSHTIFVGNHQIEFKADALRSGFAESASPNDFVKPRASSKFPRWLGIALIVVGFFVVMLVLRGLASGASVQPALETSRRQALNSVESVKKSPLVLQSVASRCDGSGSLRVNGGSHRFKNSETQIEATRMPVGDPVMVSTYSTSEAWYASTAEGPYVNLQAARIQ
ncbi:MAG: hypothetical protein ACREM6_07510 [Vulcanimicrobiaceae bacterium]